MLKNLALLARDIVALAADSREPPAEFRIFRAGANETTKGVFLFGEESQKSVMDAFTRHGADVPIDYEHKMLDWLASASDMVAAGWFTPELRGGELWASNVRWTNKAASHLREGEWRYISPAFTTGEDGRILELINVALTNLPATHQLEALVAASVRKTLSEQSQTSPKKDTAPMRSLLIALGLSENSTEADAVVALARLKEAAARNENKLSQIAKLTGENDIDDAIGVIAGHVEEVKKVAVLSARVTDLESGLRKKEVEATVGEKIQTGFLEPAKRDFAIELGMESPKAFTKFLATLTSKPMNTDGGKDKPAESSVSASKLTPVQLSICKQIGITPEEFLEAEDPGAPPEKESA